MSVCLSDSLYVVSTGTYTGVVLCQFVSVTVSMLSLQVCHPHPGDLAQVAG